MLQGDDVALQSVGCEPSGEPVGIFQVTALDPESGVAQLDVLVDAMRPSTSRRLLASFVSRAFDRLALRKLCLKTLDGALDVDSCLVGAAHLVGRLVEHDRREHGVYDDLLVYEIWPEDGG